MIKHIIWDWNGTLVNDLELCVEILNCMLLEHGKHPISIDEYRETFFFPVSKFYKFLGLPSNGVKYDILAKSYIKMYRDRFMRCELHCKVKETLKELESFAISQSILSAGYQNDVENFTRYYEVSQFMSKIDGSDNIEARGKEDRAGEHLDSLDLKPTQALMVGDTIHDWEVAQSIGCKAILFELGHIKKDRLRRVQTPIIKCLSEVVRWVRD